MPGDSFAADAVGGWAALVPLSPISASSIFAAMPADTEPLFRDAFAWHQQGRIDDARRLYQQILALEPDHPKELHLLGVVAAQEGELETAVGLLQRAVAVAPDAAGAWRDLGAALLGLGRHDAALAALDHAVALKPALAVAHFHRASVLAELNRRVEAVAAYDRVLDLTPDDPQAHYNRGIVLAELQRFEAALASYDRALALDPADGNAHRNRALVLVELKRFDAALAAFDAALALLPADPGLLVQRLDAKLRHCRWDDLDAELAAVAVAVEAPGAVCEPFALLAAIDDPALLRRAAANYVAAHCPPDPALGPLVTVARGGRLRLGYFSTDFHDHALAYLAADLFECHDRSAFELVAFSLGPESDSPMRHRLVAAFDSFLDLRDARDIDVARRARALGIDVAIDLNGFTTGAREGVFALRAAPIQVAYLGYPGTMAAPYIDYLIADRCVIPDEARPHYAEKIVYLPHSYQANDRQRPIAAGEVTRASAGLPADGFVFCCFNNNYKIMPQVFAVWMRLLGAVPGSVLWLLGDGTTAANLRCEAAARGVDPARLVFAPRLAYAEYLARYRLADLFLDTLPYNAHTTASDALWAGLPVLTCAGQSFQARVAASLLLAVGLPELVTSDLGAYEAEALDLALRPTRLAALRARLIANRSTAALFDTPGLAGALEAGYVRMCDRRQAGLPPADLVIAV